MSDTDLNTDRSRPATLVDETPVVIDNNETAVSNTIETRQDIVPTCSVSAEDATPSPQPQQKRIIYKMYQIIRDLCCIIIMAVSTYSLAFQNGGPKIAPPPSPRPFFPQGSLVTDWFRGELGSAMVRSTQHDISIIMYYAPWDAECQNVRNEFDIAANFYYKQVHFAAVNCWQPGGECAVENNRHGGQMWPGLVAHRGNRGLVYRGPYTAPYIIRFLKNLINPLHRVTNIPNLVKLVQKHDAVVHASVKDATEYHAVYNSALKLLEMDPSRDVAVAVSTSGIHENLQAERSGIQLITSNGTINSLHRNFTVNYVVSWALKHLHRPLGWTTPPGLGKSRALASILQPQSGLILFTPRNPFLERDLYYEVLRAVTLQYYSCQPHPMYTEFKNTVLLGLAELQQELRHLQGQCNAKSNINSHIANKKRNVSIFERWINGSCTKMQGINSFNTCLECTQQCEDIEFSECAATSGHDSAFITEQITNVEELEVPRNIHTSMLTGYDDPRSPRNLMRHRNAETCRFLAAARIIHEPLFTLSNEFPVFSSLEGLVCKSNLTLSITAIDSLRYAQLANVLGVDILKTPDKTKAIIIDAERESHYVMQAPFTYDNLVEFVLNFTHHKLSPEMSSKALSEKNPTHYDVYNKTACITTDDFLCILELTSKNFLPTVMEPSKTVILLYYTSQCAFCVDASRVFLILARIFAPLKSVQFVRIDGETHSLPWHYNMPFYPTILFFPARRKSETRAFPSNALRTVPNLVSFILANLEPPLNLQAMWILCHKTKFTEDIRSCMGNMQRENVKLLRKTSHELWRLGNSDTLYARAILRRLKHLRLLHLQLGTTVPSRHHSMAIKRTLERLRAVWLSETFS